MTRAWRVAARRRASRRHPLGSYRSEDGWLGLQHARVCPAVPAECRGLGHTSRILPGSCTVHGLRHGASADDIAVSRPDLPARLNEQHRPGLRDHPTLLDVEHTDKPATSNNMPEAESVEPSEVALARSADDQLIDELVGRAQVEGFQLTGECGLLQQLTKRLLESVLSTPAAVRVLSCVFGSGSGGRRPGGVFSRPTTSVRG